MRKHLFYALLTLTLLAFLLTNEYMKLEYDINLGQYFENSDALSKEELDWLKDHGDLTFGSDQSSPPLRYIDSRSNQYRGLIVDYIRALSIEIKHDIAFEPVEVWNDTFDSLKSNEKDFFDMIPSDERAKQFAFTDPIYTLHGVMLKPITDKDVKRVHDLIGKKVAIPSGDYAIEFINSKVSGVTIIETDNMENAMKLLRAGNVDVAVGDEPVVVYLLNDLDMKDTFETSEPMYKELTSLAVRKSETTLLSILNKGIFSLKKKRVMQDLQQKWFGISESFSNQDNSGKLGLVSFGFICLVSVLVYVAYSWNAALKIEVDKRTEELYLSRQKLKVIIDGMTHLMVVIDENGCIVNVNKAFCEYIQCNRASLYGKPLKGQGELFDHENVVRLMDVTFSKLLQQREDMKFKGRHYAVSTFPLTDKKMSGNNILVVFDDVTRLKVSEQRMLQDNKMQAMGVLAAGVAHEIRNPLGLIGHYSYLIKSNKSFDMSRQEKAITGIENAVERASTIIDNLLNFSRLTNDDVREVNISNAVESIIELEKKALRSSNIEVYLKCSENLVCRIAQEPLKHILMNLISNAIDAIPAKGRIDIECVYNNNTLSINVADTGVGIPVERLDEIFTPFYTTKHPGQGTGLGLYIVYNEVTKCGGSISVDSELNLGTTFSIELPVSEGVSHEHTT